MSSGKRRLQRSVAIAMILATTVVACTTDEAPPDQAEQTATDADRQRVAAFWKVYREATQARLAGDFERARVLYEQALRFDPSHEDALYYLGNVAVELNEWSEAEESWQKLVSINPASSRGFAQLGHLFLCRPAIPQFDLGRAGAAFRESIRLNREETGPLLRLAEVHLVDGRPDSAAVYVDAVLGSNPNSAEAIFVRAYVHWAQREQRTALSMIREYESRMNPEPSDMPAGEGDTRAGAGPMLAPGAGCPLVEPFGEQMASLRMNDAEILASFRMFTDRLRGVQGSNQPTR